MKRTKIALLIILLLAFFLRFYRLGDYPALNADEAAIGYNAYSLSETGRDEHGNYWPIHFQSFNDYKPGLYFYLVLPFVKLLGLNEWAVRIPSALLGVATVLVVYLLVKELEGSKNKTRNPLTRNGIAALTASFMLAISPWHIHFSRGGWEVNVATFFITLGVWLFIKAIKNPKYYVLCTLFFVLSIYTYHAARIVVPLVFLGFIVIFRNKVRKNSNKFVLAVIVGAILLIPLAYDLTRGSAFSRAAGVGLLADPGPLERINEQRGEHASLRDFAAVLLHNKPINYGLAFLENWSEHFWGEFLFLSGDDIQRNKVPETGQMYMQDFILLIAGMAAMVKWLKRKETRLILWWLVVAPAAAALTFQSPHALRAHNIVVPMVIISAIGLVYLSLWFHKIVLNKRILDILFIVFTFAISWQFTRYLHMYWIHMAKEYPFSSQYGTKELAAYITNNQDKFEHIIVTDKYDQPYILFLFHLKYPPEKFQLDHQLTPRDKYGFSTVRHFGKYRFQAIDFDEIRPRYPNSLIIGADEEIPEEANIVKEIYGSNEYKYFQVVVN